MRDLNFDEIGQLDRIGGGTEVCFAGDAEAAAWFGENYSEGYVCASNNGADFNSAVQAMIWGGGGGATGGTWGAVIGAISGFLGSFGYSISIA
jgi:hypothetical protein